MSRALDFEKPIVELEEKIQELRTLSSDGKVNIVEEVTHLQNKVERLLKQTYSNLTPWQKVQVARHPQRPQFFDYLKDLIEDFTPLAGDRLFGEDEALVGGMGLFKGRTVMIMGHQKGRETEDRLKHNFGMPKPEGYRKAQRLMSLASYYHIPILTFVDTAGAYPGLEAEERGQAEAIAKSIDVCLNVKVPLVSIVIGEGGSGGAIAIAAANRVIMLENSIYSVISPEGCASILWRSRDYAEQAAQAQKLTAQDLLEFKVIDDIIPEPLGGAHRHAKNVIQTVGDALHKHLKDLEKLDGNQLRKLRQEKFLKMGTNI